MDENKGTVEVITAYNRIPYALINAEADNSASEIVTEFAEIIKHYKVYKQGAKFTTEGTNADYVPAQLRYKQAAELINKEARFLFGETPDITISSKGDVGKESESTEDAITTIQDLVTTVLTENMFDRILIQAAKDCFIGKRVAGVVNFNEETGITINFLSSLNFIYETEIGNSNLLTKFVSFEIIKDRVKLTDKRIYKKKYVLVRNEDGSRKCYLEEKIYDGTGAEIETIIEYQPILLDRIPVVIFLNDGLTGDTDGESEISGLEEGESWFSKLANADIDCERKTMNPIRYTTDMDNRTTKNLSSAPGSYWDLQSDQNLEKPNPSVGMLSSDLSYSQSLSTTLDRIKSTMHNSIDVPDLSLESMQGLITSGKALKTVYWPLIVRCKEKMKMWGPQLRSLVSIIIQGSYVYPNVSERYLSNKLQDVKYEIKIESNYPLPEDEVEEKQTDLAEVNAGTMSRKAYMKKWRQLTDDKAEEELQQIAKERELLDNSFMSGTVSEEEPQDDELEEDSEDDNTKDNQYDKDGRRKQRAK